MVRIHEKGTVVIFGQDRNELRKMYADAWQKHLDKLPLTPLDAQLATVVEQHPEYHEVVAGDNLRADYTPEGGRSNPFLHMGLHLSIREQVATDRPPGIREVFQTLASSTGDAHAAEHQMIECLAETLWEAQSQNCAPDEQNYLQQLRRLAG
jgi:hypothetical protein